jgi:hypothetical protein
MDKWEAKDKALGEMIDYLEGYEAEGLTKSQAGKQMKKEFPGDALSDALETHTEEKDISKDDDAADRLNKIKH